MHGRFRLLALAVVGLAVATVAALLASRIRLGSGAETTAGAPQTTIPETTSSQPTLTEPTTEPSTTSSTFSPSSLTTSSSQQQPLTIATRKTVNTAPACTKLITGGDIARLTGTTAAAEPAEQGYCGFDLTHDGGAVGVAMVVLTQATDTQATDTLTPEVTTFEGNTAYRTTSTASTCELRIALTDDQGTPFRALWVRLVLNTATDSVCPTVDKLAKLVFDKLPNG